MLPAPSRKLSSPLIFGLCLAALVLWAGILIRGGFAPHGMASVSIWQFHSVAAARGSLLQLLLVACTLAVRFAPLGFAAVFMLPDRPNWIRRALFVGLPAFLIGGATAVVVVWRSDPAVGLPGLSDVFLPVAGVWAGAEVAMSLRRGLLALRSCLDGRPA